ncbi:MAG: dihydropteroate synthase [Caldimicrobium sp.]
MGILNITPDSFSDGGEAMTLEGALEKAKLLIKAGAQIIDVGGESTRPFSDPVSADEEIKRVIPVIKALREKYSDIIISVDTYKAKVAELALKAGADMVNDISGGQFDPNILDVVKDYQCPYILMHIKGTPKTMQINPHYNNVVDEIKQYFRERIEICLKKGIHKKNIILDPGLGFGKTFSHNLEILKHLEIFKEFDCPLLLGPSRKSFIGEIIQKPPKDRDAGTAGMAIYAYLKGVHILRVHNVSMINDALKIFKFLWKD